MGEILSEYISYWSDEEISSTRKVLFEKYDPYLGHVLLTDFNEWNYPLPDLDSLNKSIEAVNSIVAFKRMYGELSFKDYDSTIVNLNNVSHSIHEVILKGMKVYGKIIWLDTSSGKLAKELINSFNVKFHIRVLGTINIETNTTNINEIVTWDVKIN